MPSEQPIRLDFKDQVAVVTLDRPESLNSLTLATIQRLSSFLDEVLASDARCMIVTGAGQKAFCAGADIKEMANLGPRDWLQRTRFGQSTFARVEQLRIPSVAVINGVALGGGLELAMACTFRLAAPHAKLGLPEIKLGLIPGYGGSQRLPRLIGQARALDLILTGRTLSAEEAQRIGLVNAIIEGDALEQGIAFAKQFSGLGRLALGFALSAIRRSLDASLGEGLELEADLSTLAFQTADAREGIQAFMEKRAPRFQDR